MQDLFHFAIVASVAVEVLDAVLPYLWLWVRTSWNAQFLLYSLRFSFPEKIMVWISYLHLSLLNRPSGFWQDMLCFGIPIYPYRGDGKFIRRPGGRVQKKNMPSGRIEIVPYCHYSDRGPDKTDAAGSTE